MSDDKIFHWLSGVPEGASAVDPSATATATHRGRKRCRDDTRNDVKLCTPSYEARAHLGHDSDSDDSDMETPAKRAKVPTGSSALPTADDTTPRPTRRYQPASQPGESSVASSSSLASQFSQADTRGSGRKRRRDLENATEPIHIKSFGRSGLSREKSILPEALKKLLRDFNAASIGSRPIISWSRRDELQLAGDEADDFLEHHFCPAGETEEDESPSVQDVLSILSTATEYVDLSYEEAAWNSSVHEPLIKLAIGRGGLLKLVQCTTARIFKEFLIDSVPNGKMVDFCLSFDPFWPKDYLTATDISRAVDRVKRERPCQSINHTGYTPLTRFPIALSIETKRPSGNTEDAETQLGVWQSAQWKMLEGLVRDKTRSLAMPADASGEPDCVAAEGSSTGGNPNGGGLNGLSFLPGLCIVGHHWKFAAFVVDMTTGERSLWIDGAFGSTNSVFGIYQIIWCLRRLSRFLKEEYWPWYLENVL
ncbi:hypothetical protein MAPG_00227 [Magnaporthiopsis poae ATCC 64411]|uniref:PD-(D/E)XK nuclease-like domain-containing protein n=1 Tax=Magnaporthiopsis poae (strain ATCC 64411 / 73-15) TaxID=644358 RepID=A0A0C4DKF6_MAGP6|nr:hypothetical protein MAPG_00227 [Magnaporthiopsis poae ATCC 64411]